MGGQRKPPQGRDRALGAQLRAVRVERTNLSLEQAAEAIGWSISTLSRVENGKRHITTEDMATVLAIYGVPRPLREQMVANARTGDQTGWWARDLPGMPHLNTLISKESDARQITSWAVSVIPGLLHTRHYSEAIMRADGLAGDQVEVRWAARQKRQEVLRKIDYTAFIHEHALRSAFGGREAFREQLEHLYAVYDRGIGVRIVRQHPAALLHSWMLMEFRRDSPVVYVELMRSAVFLYDEEVKPYQDIRAKIEQSAMSSADSRRFIGWMLERL
ncbi:helix-turn-helix domain-containing protein [Actinokineospora fastidiosa]|nr:helix-turn-helix transcriptional regulator [Actinokineospora fastidiosa]